MAEGQAAAGAGTGQSTSRATLGLTGFTINAMALIAPGAFLWLTFQIQSLYGAPMAAHIDATAIALLALSRRRHAGGSSECFTRQPFYFLSRWPFLPIAPGKNAEPKLRPTALLRSAARAL